MKLEKLTVPTELIQRLKQMQAEGVGLPGMIDHLAEIGISKPVVMLALRQAGILGLGQAKIAVHHHSAFISRREADEEFQESAVACVDKFVAHDRPASAAA